MRGRIVSFLGEKESLFLCHHDVVDTPCQGVTIACPSLMRGKTGGSDEEGSVADARSRIGLAGRR